MSPPPPRVIHLVDDDASLRRGLARLLTAAGYAVETYPSAAGLLAAPQPLARGCLITDLRMPGMSGLDLQVALTSRGAALPVIFLTAHGGIPSTVMAMRQGAEDFLIKPVLKHDLLAAVERALTRETAAWETSARRRDLEARLSLLTPREKEVLTHILAGQLNKEIAADLGTSERTIKAHRASIMEKVQAHSPAELGRLGHEAGLLAGSPLSALRDG
jgi:RNA polymerase sigma factor (sigma-70 family)